MYLGVESLCRLLTANKVPFDLPTECKSKVYVLKLVSCESFSPVAEVGKLLSDPKWGSCGACVT